MTYKTNRHYSESIHDIVTKSYTYQNTEIHFFFQRSIKRGLKKSHTSHTFERYSCTYTSDNQCKTVQDKTETQRSVRKMEKAVKSQGSLNKLVEKQA
jgi:hypothetical protein